MADGKQWYNRPPEDSSGKANGRPVNPAKKAGKPGVNKPGNRPAGSGVKPAGQPSGKRYGMPSGKAPANNAKQPYGNPSAKPAGGKPVSGRTGMRPMPGTNSAAGVKQSAGIKQSAGSKIPAGTKQPIGSKQTVKAGRPGMTSAGRNQQGFKGNPNKQGKSIIPDMDTYGQANKAPFNKNAVKKQAGMASGKRFSANQNNQKAVPGRKANNERPKPVDKERAKIIAREKEQQKILEQARLKEEAKIKEQQKIEKNEFKRKNPSQKSAESRAIRNGILGAVAVASALFVLAFVIHHLYDYIAEKPNFSFVTTGAVEHTIGARALVVRDEDTINCVNSGELVTQITEGSRVAKDQELAIVVPDEMKSVVQDLRNVQSQISDVQQEIIMGGGVAEADIIYRNYNKNLSAILDSVRYDSMGGNLSNMSSYGSSVNVILDEREDEMSKINFDDERISVLRNDESVYEAQVEKYASRISAHRPGIVSFRLDGKEEELDYKMFLSMPVSDVKGYINNSVGAIASDLSVDADTPVVRIAQNESQYLSVYLSSNDAAASDFAVGTFHDINIRTEGISIDNCQVVRCENDNSGMLITFETSRCVEALLDLRTVDIEIVITETDGMRVAVPSLVNEIYAPKGNPAFCVYIAPGASVGPDTFADSAVFNVTIIPNEKRDEAGNLIEQQNTSVGGCTVIHTESLEDGGYIVAFSTPNDYSNLKKIDRLYTEGYTASFVDTATGLGMTAKKVIVSDYSGMASVYTNNQGFVEEIRVIVLDNDREFAIIDQVGKSPVPNLNTVIITNPKTVKPGDKVD